MIAGLLAACGLPEVDGPMAGGVTIRVEGAVARIAAVERQHEVWQLSGVQAGHDGLGIRVTAGPSTTTPRGVELKEVVADWGGIHLTAARLAGADENVALTEVSWTDAAGQGKAASAVLSGETLQLLDDGGLPLGQLSRSGFRPQ